MQARARAVHAGPAPLQPSVARRPAARRRRAIGARRLQGALARPPEAPPHQQIPGQRGTGSFAPPRTPTRAARGPDSPLVALQVGACQGTGRRQQSEAGAATVCMPCPAAACTHSRGRGPLSFQNRIEQPANRILKNKTCSNPSRRSVAAVLVLLAVLLAVVVARLGRRRDQLVELRGQLPLLVKFETRVVKRLGPA